MSGTLMQLPAGEKGQAGQCWAQGRGLGGGGAVQLLRPSQDAPDAAMGSVCVQGDQDIGRADSMSLLAGPGGGMGSGGGSFWEPGLPAGPGGVSRHLFTCPAPQRSPDLTWVSQRLWACDPDVHRQVWCEGVWACMGARGHVSTDMCICGWVCAHVWGLICTCRGLNARAPRSQGRGRAV